MAANLHKHAASALSLIERNAAGYVLCFTLGLPAAGYAAPALETIRAIHRLVTRWDERHSRLSSAFRANSVVHFAGSAGSASEAAGHTAAVCLAPRAAIRAARRGIAETLLGIECLLARRKRKLAATVTAGHGLVFVVQLSLLGFYFTCGSRTWIECAGVQCGGRDDQCDAKPDRT